ncbi:MAG: FAD-dependent oxidoreductase, partial [Candidatus Lindowbacteria bacterium]|nr:FAD-dependent oxidoreductase [Candidatus Lindowbacteria bacterium]
MQAKGAAQTVPQVFADGEYVGDCNRLYELDAEGELDAKLGLEESQKEEDQVSEEIRNVIIIGSDPAGYTAGLYASRANLNPLLFSGMQPGGQLTITTDVENYPGFPDGVQGPEMMVLFRKQAEKFGTEVIDAAVDKVDLVSNPKVVESGGKTYLAKAVIISTGASAKWLGIPGEAPAHEGGYGGKGVSACATCDGFFFKGEKIAIVGGGDTCLEEAIFLTNFGESVTVIHRREELRASQIMQDRAKKNEKIKFMWNTTVEEVLGDGDKVTALKLKDAKTGETREEEYGGFFVAIGHKPNSDLFVDQLKISDSGYLDVPNPGRTPTEIPGVFAAGDITDHY